MLQLHDIDHILHPVLRRSVVRIVLAGCPLRCAWCDVPDTHFGGREVTSEHILEQIEHMPSARVMITGGEPMAQAACLPLLQKLATPQRELWIDTSGHIDLASVSADVRILADIKCPGSGMAAHNRDELPASLSTNDILLYTLLDRHDYEWAKAHTARNQTQAEVCFGMTRAEPARERGRLAEWVIDDSLDVTCV